MALKIKIWGSRGSLPSPQNPHEIEKKIRSSLHEFIEDGNNKVNQIERFLRKRKIHENGGYGGNTLCVEAQTSNVQIIIDGGSGLRILGYDLMKGPCGKGKGEVHLVFTHFHWDHISGLPFFVPLFIPGNKIHVYAVQEDLPLMFEMLFKKPFFPVELKDLAAKIIFHKLDVHKKYKLRDILFTPFHLDHPDPCYGYRLEHGGKSYAHCVDTEGTSLNPKDIGDEAKYYKNLDLMLFDAQYTTREKYEKIDWGHASASLGLDIAMLEGIKKVVFTHHDPSLSDDKIFEYENEARAYYQMKLAMVENTSKKLHTVDWSFAYDGMEIKL